MILVKYEGRIVSAMRVTTSAMPEYRAWAKMIERCYKRKAKQYKNYGLRGIRVCDAWRQSFVQFYLDVGPRPSPQHSLHRIDNDEHYLPENCKWALRPEQDANKQNTVWVEYAGQRVRLVDLAARLKLAYPLLASRLKLGWPLEVAISQPKGKHYKSGPLRKPLDMSPEAQAKRVRSNAANKKRRRARRGLT